MIPDRSMGESMRTQSDAGVNRRDLLRLGGAAMAALATAPHLGAGSGRGADAEARRHHQRDGPGTRRTGIRI